MSKRIKLLDGSLSECSPSSSTLTDFETDNIFSDCQSLDSVSSIGLTDGDDEFLGLPFHIWTRIFHYAGIVCSCPIDLVTVNHRPAGSRNTKRRRSSDTHSNVRATSNDTVTCALRRRQLFKNVCKHSSFIPMLAVSSQVRHITRKAIFRESPLCMTLRTLEDLMGFKQTLRGFKGMTPLEDSLKAIHVSLVSYDGRKLKGVDKRKSVVNLFRAFSDYFGANLQGKLKDFSFECRVGDTEAARELVGKMGDNYHMLETCGLRFEFSGPVKLRNELVSIATQAAANSITWVGHQTQAFRFMDLPNEIKEMILKELLIVKWDPLAKKNRSGRGGVALQRGIPGRPKANEKDCCWECSPHLESGCYCPHESAYSTSCICFASPLPIFLTSKFMYEMASHIFYTHNTFVMKGGQPFILRDILAKQVSPKHLKNIRHLVMDLSYLWPLPSLHPWTEIANFIRENFDITRLQFDMNYLTVNDIFSPGMCDKIFAEFEGIDGRRTRVDRVQRNLPAPDSQSE